MPARQLGQQTLAAVMEVLDRAAGPGPMLSVEAAEPIFDGGERGGQVTAAMLVVKGQLAQGQPISALRRLLPIRDRRLHLARLLRARGQAQERCRAHRAYKICPALRKECAVGEGKTG